MMADDVREPCRFDVVLYEGRPALKLTREVGEARKNTRMFHVEHLGMSAAVARVMARDLLAAARESESAGTAQAGGAGQSFGAGDALGRGGEEANGVRVAIQENGGLPCGLPVSIEMKGDYCHDKA
jgi:hypothetical protein